MARIHTKIVIRISDGAVLHEEGYDYSGPLAEAKGTVNVPGPSPQEEALRQEQISALQQQRDILQQQLNQQNLLAPIVFQQAGLTPEKDEAGNIIGFTEDPTQAGIRQQLLQRTQQALAGELPVAPGLLRDLGKQGETLREQLRKNLGPGFETSTPGIEALSRFDEMRNIVLEGARQGQLTLGEQLGLQRQQAQLQSAGFAGGFPFQGAGGFGQIAAGFEGPLSQLFSQRQLQTQANIANAQASTDTFGALIRGAGSFGGLALGGYLGRGSGTAPFLVGSN